MTVNWLLFVVLVAVPVGAWVAMWINWAIEERSWGPVAVGGSLTAFIALLCLALR